MRVRLTIVLCGITLISALHQPVHAQHSRRQDMQEFGSGQSVRVRLAFSKRFHVDSPYRTEMESTLANTLRLTRDQIQELEDSGSVELSVNTADIERASPLIDQVREQLKRWGINITILPRDGRVPSFEAPAPSVVENTSDRDIAQVADALQVDPDLVRDVLKKAGVQNPESLDFTDLFREVEKQRQRTQQVVDRQYPPMLIIGGSTEQSGVVGDPSVSNLLTKTKKGELVKIARSVGRIEISLDSAEYEPIGTAFVISDGTVATNCHVIREIAEIDPQTNSWILRKHADEKGHTIDVAIDFGTDRNHQIRNEFKVIGVLAVPSTTGFDVGLLKVSALAADGKASLPHRLSPGQYDPKHPEIVVIGYPDLDHVGTDIKDREMFRRLVEREDVAKIISPGRISGPTAVHGFEILNHRASTQGGQSGSPVIELHSMNVVGVHFCCAQIGASTRSDLPCASYPIETIEENEAIGTTGVLSDPTLSPFWQTATEHDRAARNRPEASQSTPR